MITRKIREIRRPENKVRTPFKEGERRKKTKNEKEAKCDKVENFWE